MNPPDILGDRVNSVYAAVGMADILPLACEKDLSRKLRPIRNP